MSNKENWIYAAAMVDAEGCISIGAANHVTSAGTTYKAYMLRIQVANTSQKLMDFFVENFGGVVYKKKQALNPGRPVFQWFTKGGVKAQEVFLLGILPYLLIKREQALNALEFIRCEREQNPSKRKEFYDKNKALNRGESVTTNTSGTDNSVKIESELMGDHESGPVVTQQPQNNLGLC
jgi:hypothetical protein